MGEFLLKETSISEHRIKRLSSFDPAPKGRVWVYPYDFSEELPQRFRSYLLALPLGGELLQVVERQGNVVVLYGYF